MIGSVDKAIQILNCFSQEEPILGVGEISRLTGFTPSTVSRILSTLEAHAVVEKTEGYGRYQFGCRIYLWGLINKIQNSLVTSARPVMEQLRDETGEEVSLYVVTGNHRTRIERVESRHAIAMVGRVGGRLPLHTGASGQMLLAYMGEAERRALLEKRHPEGLHPQDDHGSGGAGSQAGDHSPPRFRRQHGRKGTGRLLGGGARAPGRQPSHCQPVRLRTAVSPRQGPTRRHHQDHHGGRCAHFGKNGDTGPTRDLAPPRLH